MDFVSTIIGILIIVAALVGAVIYIWKSKDKSKPNYMVEPKLTKEEKKALKASAQAEEKPEKKVKQKVKKSK